MTAKPEVVASVAGLEREHGRLAIVVGVFDGLHLGHAHLLRALAEHAARWHARPTVVTFDAHPDAVLRGEAPPVLLDSTERLRLLGEAGVEVVIVEHFDDRLRMTPYDAFVRAISSRVEIAGFVMTPDTAFGHERRGTPAAVAQLGAGSSPPFEVAVVDPLQIDGRTVSSSEIRRLVSEGQFREAAALLGRPYAVVGERDDNGTLRFPMPVALPAPGDYPASTMTEHVVAHVRDGVVAIDVANPIAGRITLMFDTA